MDINLIKELILTLPILFFSVILHECGHGIVAYKYGDPTAKMLGRITLNPIPHIDIFGTIILPVIMAITTGGKAVFGWAKPVPVNPFNLRHPKRDMIWVSLGGLAANILLACIGIVVLVILSRLPMMIGENQVVDVLARIFAYLFFINVLLATFNFIPIPPLDGSRIVMGLLPTPLSQKYARLEPFGIIIVFALLYLGVFDIVFKVVLHIVMLIFPVLF
ncbi:MAG: site-2 protease family protein [bacterium]|nr:site-2 protease family protein [bacterium]